MRYFVDTEFYEDGRTIDLISIGVKAEDGREFYAASIEARLDLVNDWVREHVLPNLPPYSSTTWMRRSEIARLLTAFVFPTYVPSGYTEKAEFWGYFSDYDWVAICQLYGTMMDLPVGFPMYCRDLKQLSDDVGQPKHPPDPVGEHSALVDARWNYDLYTFLMQKLLERSR